MNFIKKIKLFFFGTDDGDSDTDRKERREEYERKIYSKEYEYNLDAIMNRALRRKNSFARSYFYSR